MVLKYIRKEKNFEKILLLFIMCVIISFTFVSCTNDTSSKNKISSQSNNETITEQNTTDNNSESLTNSNTDKLKTIKKLYVNYNGFKMNVNFGENDITELLGAEKNTVVPDVKMKMVFADVIAIYNDNTEEVFGTVCVGEDDCYYLQFANSKVEGAAFKMSDSLFSN